MSDTESWDEESLVLETFGRGTYNFSGGTGIGPIYQEKTCLMESSDDEQDYPYSDEDDYPDSDDDETRTTICGW